MKIFVPTGASYTITDAPGLEVFATAQLVSLRNFVAAQSDLPPIKKFADRDKAKNLTWNVIKHLDVLDMRASAPQSAPAVEQEAVAAAATPTPEPAVAASDHETMADTPLGLAAQAAVLPETVPVIAKVRLSKEERAAIADEAKSRKAAEKAVKDAAIKLPTGKRMAKRQKDGSYAFSIAPTKPRTQTVSEQREELLGLLLSTDCTWADIKEAFNKDDFKTVTTVTMFCISLGYGLRTREDGTIELHEPLA